LKKSSNPYGLVASTPIDDTWTSCIGNTSQALKLAREAQAAFLEELGLLETWLVGKSPKSGGL